MDTPDPDAPELYCRHLLICRAIWYDPAKPDDGYSLGRLVVDLVPPPGEGSQFVVPRLFAFVQFYGDIGDYDLRIRLVPVTMHDDEEPAIQEWGPRLTPVSGLTLVESLCFVLNNVPFIGPGLYEFQLWSDEHTEMLAAERIRVESPIRELP